MLLDCEEMLEWVFYKDLIFEMKISKIIQIVWLLAVAWIGVRYFVPGKKLVETTDLGSDYAGQVYTPPKTALEQALIDKTISFQPIPEGFSPKVYTLAGPDADYQFSTLGGVLTKVESKNLGIASSGKAFKVSDSESPLGLGAVLFSKDSPVDFSDVSEVVIDGKPGLRMVGQSSSGRVEKTFVLNGSTASLSLVVKAQPKDPSDLARLALVCPYVEKLPNDSQEAIFWSDKTKSIVEPGAKDSSDLNIKLPRLFGLTDRYFCAVLKDDAGFSQRAYTTAVKNRLIGLVELDWRSKDANTYDLFIGPKDTKALAAFSAGLENILNFGWLDFFAKLLLWFIQILARLFSNLGLAIVFLAFLLRLLFLPLSVFFRRKLLSLNRFERSISGQIAQIKKTWATDLARQQNEISLLYKKHGFSQMEGMQKIIPRIPDIIFYFLIYRLVSGAHIFSGASAFLWLKDLSLADPYKILPVALGLFSMISTFGDAATKPKFDAFKVMTPILIVYMISGFPAGAVLFSVVIMFLNQLEDFILSKIYA